MNYIKLDLVTLRRLSAPQYCSTQPITYKPPNCIIRVAKVSRIIILPAESDFRLIFRFRFLVQVDFRAAELLQHIPITCSNSALQAGHQLEGTQLLMCR